MIIVKIVNYMYDQIWYAGNINDVFLVRNHPDKSYSDMYQVIEVGEDGEPLEDDKQHWRVIYKRDCEVMKAKSPADIYAN